VFLRLINQDLTGTSWLPRILERVAEASGNEMAAGLTGVHSPLRPELVGPPTRRRSINGQKNLNLPYCFEYRLSPPQAFLRWLLETAGAKWAANKKDIPRKLLNIKERRELLVGSVDEVEKARSNALAELNRLRAGNSFRKWWAFEGFSSVDCFLETDEIVLLIEGKRNDILSPTTKWYPERNQLARNLEVAEYQANGKQFGRIVSSIHRMCLLIADSGASVPSIFEEVLSGMGRDQAG